ncbi:MAG: 3-deoxy-8-phosphooctulonate synthase [Bdellovibrionaceae bacterium]|nr:3-deoxy-8-phosphooctulonate synthase [Pseudobdellovibrionaceae bacterium]
MAPTPITSGDQRMIVLAGPCVIEDEGLILETAAELKRQFEGLPIDFYFKASFDKANRTSIKSFRGPGLEEGLAILAKAKARSGVQLVTDYHLPEQAEPVAEVVDFLQVPAFLCRQTDMIVAGAQAVLKRGKKINVKKGQFLAPWDAKNIVQKLDQVAEDFSPSDKNWYWITERGVSFGYNTLIVDMSAFQTIQKLGAPVIYDATHSVQSPGAGAGGTTTGGKRENIEVLARAAIAAGADGLFMECHPDPSRAKSDGPNAFYLEHAGTFVRQLLEIRKLVGSQPRLLPNT